MAFTGCLRGRVGTRKERGGPALGYRSSAIGARLSDWGKLSASEFRVDQEPEWIRQLALLHQPVQNRLPELS